MSLLERVRRYAGRHQMWRPETRVVGAVSGGSDSVGMLFLLDELHRRGELNLVAVAHLNHQIRPEAAADEAFCARLADRLQVPFESARVDVPEAARARRQSIEVAGRMARREFLDAVRVARRADVVALAHTIDDQAETLLMRLARGSGQRGFAGMAPHRQHRIRPVLCATRGELRAELQFRGEPWREDATNADLAQPRNRIRHELIPYLERHFNPAVRQALARAAEGARADATLLDRLASTAAVGLFERMGRDVTLDAERFRRLPDALKRRAAMQALAFSRSRAPSYAEVTAFVDEMEHFDAKRVLVHETHAPFSFALPVPGAVKTDAGWIIEAEAYDLPQGLDARADVAQIDAAVPEGSLTVRSRRPGDRVRPVGLGGTKKLQDVLVDKKVVRSERDAVPIVTDAQGRIIWVAGHVMGEEFRVTERTKGVIILKLRRI